MATQAYTAVARCRACGAIRPVQAAGGWQVPRLPRHPRRTVCHSVASSSVDAQAAAAVLSKLKIEPATRTLLASSLTEENVDLEQLADSVRELEATFLPQDVQRLVAGAPHALALPIADWAAFFAGYSLSKEALWRVLRYGSGALACTDVYTAGAAIAWLKALGPWSDADIAGRLIPCYPAALAVTTEQLDALAARLAGTGLEPDDVARLLYECPGIIADFREEQLPALEAMAARRAGKYVRGASYAD